MVEGQLYSSHSTRSGVGLDGLFRWGDHVCHFYRSADDLSEVLVPYFKAGLERNELCLWVTASPYWKDRAVGKLRTADAFFDRRAMAEQIQILDEKEWYAKLALQRPAERVQCWLAQKERALASGICGLRGSRQPIVSGRCQLGQFCDLAQHAVESGVGGRAHRGAVPATPWRGAGPMRCALSPIATGMAWPSAMAAGI